MLDCTSQRLAIGQFRRHMVREGAPYDNQNIIPFLFACLEHAIRTTTNL